MLTLESRVLNIVRMRHQSLSSHVNSFVLEPSSDNRNQLAIILAANLLSHVLRVRFAMLTGIYFDKCFGRRTGLVRSSTIGVRWPVLELVQIIRGFLMVQ